jgi:uncharacterized repeat protein (TIGR03809 family)
MPELPSGARFDRIARKWHDLAEHRLAYFTELYHSGRWAHYYSREHFALRMRDVIMAVKIWRELAGLSSGERPAARDDELRPAA